MPSPGKPENPLKPTVIDWVKKSHAKSPFPTVKAAADAATAHFKKEPLPTTLRQWVADAIGHEPKKRATGRNKEKKAKQEVFTFDIALRQIEAIKTKMIDGLKNQYKQILQAESKLEEQKKKLESDIATCAKLTGRTQKEISAQLESIQ